MSTRAKNIAVGLTVIMSLAVLATMILMFAGMPQAFRGGYTINLQVPDCGGAKAGDDVSLGGMKIGKVTKVFFTNPDPRQGVTVQLHVEKGLSVPANVSAHITRGLVGGAAVDLRADLPVQPGAPTFLPTDGSARIKGVYESSDMMGQLKPAIDSLAKLSESLSGLTGETAEPTSQAATRPGAQGALAKLSLTLDGLNKIIGDPENQQNIKATLSELREFSANGKEAMLRIRDLAQEATQTAAAATVTAKSMNQATTRISDNADQLTIKLIQDAEAISRSMDGLTHLIGQIEQGQGTAGKLVNDPHLYNNLVDVADQMSSLMKETRELIQQWKTKGMDVRMK